MDSRLASRVQIYTDGGCDPNPGPGGWGAVLVCGAHTKEISGADRATTNNRMELTAAISALSLLNRPCPIDLYTDSQYLRRGVLEWLPRWRARGWRLASGRPVQNQDLWQQLAEELGRHDIEWHWVRGHSGDSLNERADRLATRARQMQGRTDSAPTVDYGAGTRAECLAFPVVDIYPRGCALGVPGPAGYAAVLVAEGQGPEVVSGRWALATNNAMELWAVVAGLRTLRRRSKVTVHSPSKYVVEGASRWLATWERRSWRTRDGSPVKNRELWQELAHLMGDHDVSWRTPSDGGGAHSHQAATVARNEAEQARGAAGSEQTATA